MRISASKRAKDNGEGLEVFAVKFAAENPKEVEYLTSLEWEVRDEIDGWKEDEPRAPEYVGKTPIQPATEQQPKPVATFTPDQVGQLLYMLKVFEGNRGAWIAGVTPQQPTDDLPPAA